MKHLRTLSNNWYRARFEIWGCVNHQVPAHNSDEKDCKACKDLGSSRFYYMRRFLIALNAKRTKRILTHTSWIYNLLRSKKPRKHELTIQYKQKLYHIRKASHVAHIIMEFLGPSKNGGHPDDHTRPPWTSETNPNGPYDNASNLSTPYWHHEWLPLPSNSELLRRWELPTTAVLIERRRANLLGNLVRHNAVPLHNIAINTRASWWKQCTSVMVRMNVNLENAHQISFWKNTTKQRLI